MTIIKICGLTNIPDACFAAQSGADMLGFIFYPRSPRYVTPAVVREIAEVVHALSPHTHLVGVFVNETAANIRHTLEVAKLDTAQLNGDEPFSMLQSLEGMAYPAVRTDSQAQLILSASRAASPNLNLPELLLDADHPTLYGGSGTRAAESLASSLARQCRLLLAGGLRPENVAAVLAAVCPWGVDVSSGVEQSPGKKDFAKVESFIHAVREYDRIVSR